MRGGEPTLLDVLIRERRLTRNEARELLCHRAAGMGVTERRFALSERQLYRLLGGEVKTLPHPVVCRVLEAEFGYPVAQLLGPGSVRPLDPGRRSGRGHPRSSGRRGAVPAAGT